MTEYGEILTETAAVEQGTPARQITEILITSLTALADAGEVEAACRLAGQAYVAVRRTDRTAARRFDVLLHRLSPRLTWSGGRDRSA